jgi:hypothetical protein
MSSCCESDVVVYTIQREPTLLQGRSTRRPTEHVQNILITAVYPGEIHSQIPSAAVQNRTELAPQSLGSVLINSTPQDHAGIVNTTPHDGHRQIGRVIHGFLRRQALHVCRQGPGQLNTPARHDHQPSNRHCLKRGSNGQAPPDT